MAFTTYNIAINSTNSHDYTTKETLANGAREVLARAGYQVGDCEVFESFRDGWINANIEIDDTKASRKIASLSGTMTWYWGDFTVECEL